MVMDRTDIPLNGDKVEPGVELRFQLHKAWAVWVD